MKKTNLKKTIFLAMLTAIGVAIGFVENSIPLPIPLPGARLGLSNIVILTTLVYVGKKEGLVVALLKSLLLMLVTGHVSSFFYSFTGGLLASLAMIGALALLKGASLIGISLIGSAFHNLGQVLVASLMVQNIRIFYYLPLLLVLGVFTGAFVGYASGLLIEHLEKILPKESIR